MNSEGQGFTSPPAPTTDEPKKSNKLLWTIISIIVVLLLCVVLILAYLAFNVANLVVTKNEVLATIEPTSLSPSATPLGGGGRIAYSVQAGEFSNEIYIYDVVTGEDRQLTDTPDAYKHGYSFSPDGKHLVFSSNFHPPDSWIYSIDLDGKNLKRLVGDEFRNWFGDWSPDGTKIAFASDRMGDFNIFTINIDGTDLTRITSYKSGAPDWSPDGKQIAFQTEKDGNFEIYVMNADGTSAKRLTNNPANDMSPVWSPDGKQIAFYSEVDGSGEIFLMNADGSNQINLTLSKDSESMRSWSPDGKNITFESNQSGSYRLYIINIETREVSTIPIHKKSSAGVWAP